MPIVIILALLISGSTSFAAEGSLPGDALYPVKIHVNEEVRGWLAASAEAQSQWESRRVERRLQEAEQLAAKGRLSAETEVQVASNFDAHADRVQERIEKFETDEDFEATVDLSAKFETSLRAHEKILERLAERQDEEESGIDAFRHNVRTKADAAANVRIKAEKKITANSSAQTQVAAEGKKGAAENKIAEATQYLARVKAALGAEATAKAESRLSIAEEVLAEGSVKLAAGVYGEAFILFQEAHDIAQEAKLLIQARQNLKLDVKLNGDVRKNLRMRVETSEESDDTGDDTDEDNNDDSNDTEKSGTDKNRATSVRFDAEFEVELKDLELEIIDAGSLDIDSALGL
ncbi:MAG: hypothetical protein Q8Q39_00350 [bacterium]|nr:hypothetical protein [bacterium]